MNFPTQHRIAHAAYEHVQVDLQHGAFCDGIHSIHRYPDPGVTVSVVIGGGNVVDLTAAADNGGPLDPMPPTATHDDAATPRATLRRAWHLPEGRRTLHAESWVNHHGNGFVDLFIRLG